MINSTKILKVYEETFSCNTYTVKPFRMIGLIDVDIEYYYGVEKVTLAFYSSSGTNSDKVKGLWYPIVGIKMHTGEFNEFSEYINFILKNTTENLPIRRGWLAKSLFFNNQCMRISKINGFSDGKYYKSLLKIGETLRNLYEHDKFHTIESLDRYYLNKALMSNLTYPGNSHKQVDNFERFMGYIYNKI